MFDSLSDDSENFFGLVSSILSNFLFDIFGIVSYLFCVFLIFNGVRVVLGRETAWYSWLMLPITIILLCFILGSFNTQLALPFLSSGILGEGLIIYYDHYIGSTEYSNITYIFLILLLFISIFLTFNIGYFEIKNSILVLVKSIFYLILIVGRALNLTNYRSHSFFLY